MGLDTSHDAFHGAYSAFNRFRQIVCQAIGGSYPSHWLRNDDGSLKRDSQGFPICDTSLDDNLIYFPEGGLDEESGMYAFLCHSDCDGEIPPEACLKLADELEAVLPVIEKIASVEQAGGHIAARGGYVEVTKKFIAGCRDAASKNEPLDFH